MDNKDAHDTPPPLPLEKWRPVRNYEGLYEVSNHAQVRSLPRQTRTGIRGGKLLVQQPDGHGYRHVRLFKQDGGRTVKVYALVAAAFIGPTPAGQEIRHGPAGIGDDSAWNLSFGTRAQNEQDKIRDGTFRHGVSLGEAHGMVKLTASDVITIRELYAAGIRQVKLARQFNVTQANISRIVKRQTWRHL
jgi:hypothetical protein